MDEVGHIEDYKDDAPSMRTGEKKRHYLVKQVWTYTTAVWVVFGGLASLLADDAWVALPVGILCLLVGILGTLLAVLRSLDGGYADPKLDSIFR